MSATLPKGRPVRSVAVMGVSQAFKVVTAIISAAALARFLTPKDFGLVATVSPLMILAMMLQDMGFTQAIIQRKDVTRDQVNALFWLNVAVAAALCAIMVAGAPLIARFFGDDRIVGITYGSAVFVMLWALTAQPLALLNRELKFTSIAAVDMINSATMLMVGVAVAAATHSYWAILISQISGASLGLAVALSRAGWRPGPPVLDQGVREMVRFGATLSGSNIFNYIGRNADNFLLARFSTQTQLGLYDRSYKLMLMPLMQVNAPLGRVLLPLLSRLNDDPAAYRRAYLTTISYLMAALHPAVLCAVIFAPSFIHILLGPRWDAAAPIFMWLGAVSLHQVVSNTLGWLFVSQGRAKALFVRGAYNCATTVAAFIIGLPYGAVGVAGGLVGRDANRADQAARPARLCGAARCGAAGRGGGPGGDRGDGSRPRPVRFRRLGPAQLWCLRRRPVAVPRQARTGRASRRAATQLRAVHARQARTGLNAALASGPDASDA
jgi:polysaccharide transporter, PST family